MNEAPGSIRLRRLSRVGFGEMISVGVFQHVTMALEKINGIDFSNLPPDSDERREVLIETARPFFRGSWIFDDDELADLVKQTLEDAAA